MAWMQWTTERVYVFIPRKTQDAGWQRGWLYRSEKQCGYGGETALDVVYTLNEPNLEVTP